MNEAARSRAAPATAIITGASLLVDGGRSAD
jgi:hypothetical protein